MVPRTYRQKRLCRKARVETSLLTAQSGWSRNSNARAKGARRRYWALITRYSASCKIPSTDTVRYCVYRTILNINDTLYWLTSMGVKQFHATKAQKMRWLGHIYISTGVVSRLELTRCRAVTFRPGITSVRFSWLCGVFSHAQTHTKDKVQEHTLCYRLLRTQDHDASTSRSGSNASPHIDLSRSGIRHCGKCSQKPLKSHPRNFCTPEYITGTTISIKMRMDVKNTGP